MIKLCGCTENNRRPGSDGTRGHWIFCSLLSYFSKCISYRFFLKEGGCTICYIHCLYSELEIYFLRRKKNQLVLNLFMDFCDQCESTQRGSVGPSSSQLMCLKGNYHWCCFPFLSGQRASRSCHGPPATREELPSNPDRYSNGTWTAERMASSGGWCAGKTIRSVGCAESNIPTVRESLTRANCESNQGWEYWLLIYLTKHTLNKYRGNTLCANSLTNGFHVYRIFI